MDDRIRRCLIRDHSLDGRRSGEGSIVRLDDGRLLLLFTSFQGGSDHSRADLFETTSQDGGLTWSVPELFLPTPPEVINHMSVSVLRLRDGRIGCVFCRKYSPDRLMPFWTASADEGSTWSVPMPLLHELGYFVVNNDRLAQLSNGTLVIPYALHRGIKSREQYEHFDPAWNAACGLIYSLDGGAHWQRSPHEITFIPEFFREPLYCDFAGLREGNRHQIRNRLDVFQEPGVQELRDGKLLMYMRSTWAVYLASAAGVDAPWRDCDIIKDFHVCLGPQTIKRLPDSENLVLFYNDRGTIPLGDPRFFLRTPLSIASSLDSGRSWQRMGQLEDDTHNYCYFSLLFTDGEFISTYYQSALSMGAGGVESRRNLASLKLARGPVSFLTPSPIGEGRE